jgi:cytochrome c-type biogenesis protein
MMADLPLPMAAFLAGLISFLSPCVLPLVPGYVSLISGVGVDELRRPTAHVMRTVMVNAVLFVAGFSVVFIALGAIASEIGRLVGQHIAVLSQFAGVVIVVFGLHMIGLVPIRWLDKDRRFHHLGEGATATGSFLVGFSFGFGWTPCVGPIFGTILALSASEATVREGALLLAVYSLGLAVPFLITALAVDRFLVFYGRFRRHLHTLEVVSGGMLVAVGVLIFTRHFAAINALMNRVPFFRTIAERFL